MEPIIDVLLQAGRSTLGVALYTLLPIMVVMMILMRLLEVSCLLARLVDLVAPLVRPFGLSGLGVLAMLQISFVSFVAPITTLALMDDQGASDRKLATALAAVLAMAPANAVFPLAAMGLATGPVLAWSLLGGLSAAALTYRLFGRRLSVDEAPVTAFEKAAHERPSFLSIVNVSGREAIEIILNIIPVLLLSLVVVFGLQRLGAIAALSSVLAPALEGMSVDPALVLPALTKFLAGSTALVGVAQQMTAQGTLSPGALNRSAGFLLHPLDLPGVAIFASASRRLGSVLVPALLGASSGIAVRVVGSAILT
jgi:spore maturation protein SpmB